MDNDPINLLNRLAAVSRATGAATRPTGPAAAPGAAFADLLSRAQAGEIASERPVSISDDAAAAGVKLDAQQLARISAAADRAEVAGIRNALVLIDGQALTLDVANRTITGAATASGDAGPGVVAGIDGLINLTPGLLKTPEKPDIVPLPSLSGASPSLAAILQKREAPAPKAA